MYGQCLGPIQIISRKDNDDEEIRIRSLHLQKLFSKVINRIVFVKSLIIKLLLFITFNSGILMANIQTATPFSSDITCGSTQQPMLLNFSKYKSEIPF